MAKLLACEVVMTCEYTTDVSKFSNSYKGICERSTTLTKNLSAPKSHPQPSSNIPPWPYGPVDQTNTTLVVTSVSFLIWSTTQRKSWQKISDNTNKQILW